MSYTYANLKAELRKAVLPLIVKPDGSSITGPDARKIASDWIAKNISDSISLKELERLKRSAIGWAVSRNYWRTPKSKDRMRKTYRNYFLNNTEKRHESSRISRSKESTRSKISEWNRRKYLTIPVDVRRKYSREYVAGRRRTDSAFRLALNCRARLGAILKKKTAKTFDAICCDKGFLAEWLTSTAPEGAAHSECHVDHIFPLSRCATNEDVLSAFHWRNLRLIPADENRHKGNRIDDYSIVIGVLVGVKNVFVKSCEKELEASIRMAGLTPVIQS